MIVRVLDVDRLLVLAKRSQGDHHSKKEQAHALTLRWAPEPQNLKTSKTRRVGARVWALMTLECADDVAVQASWSAGDASRCPSRLRDRQRVRPTPSWERGEAHGKPVP